MALIVRVQVERGRRTRVSEQPLSVVDRHPVVDQPSLIRVAQIVEPEPGGRLCRRGDPRKQAGVRQSLDGTPGGHGPSTGRLNWRLRRHRHPDIALIVPADGDRLHLVEQYRYPVAGRRWEFPAGGAEAGLDHDPAALAERELREETGLVAGGLTPLGVLEVTPSMVNHRCWVFLAIDLTQGAPQWDLEEQGMRSAWFTRAEVERMIRNGTVTDGKSVAAFALLMLRGETSPD